MAFALTLQPRQKPIAAKTTMKEKKNNPLVTLCILLFHLGLLYLAYEQLAPKQQRTKVEQKIQNIAP